MGPENLFTGPIPGQSLTRSPDQRAPYEMPPKFASSTAALDHLLLMITDRTFIKNLAILLRQNKKLKIDRMASAILQQGFVNGMWTVDTAMLLIEPLLCLMVWAAAQQDASVTFSNDTGYEDRTGFDYVSGALGGDPDEVMNDRPVSDTDVLEEKHGAEQAPEAPAQAAAPQSPLVGGI